MFLPALKEYALSQDEFNTAFSTQNIGFSGVNKIIGIVEVISEQDKYRDFKLIYGDIPDDFYKQWEYYN
jgi:hypothetical protein